MKKKLIYTSLFFSLFVVFFLGSCSNKKNTTFTRLYHDVNTRYNVHFNANEAYKEALKAKKTNIENQSNFSDFLYLYPLSLDTTNSKYRGQFTKTIDKTTKAIKLHSISRKPQIDRSRIKDEEYTNWLKSKEFNPYLVNSWKLLAEAQLEEENYLQSIATLLYLSKIYENDPSVVAFARLNLVRAYAEMGWIYEADNLLKKIEQQKLITPDNENLYNSLKSNVMLRKEEYQDAIKYLKLSIPTEKDGQEKRRKRYLLAQLYEHLGEKQLALETYNQIKGLTLPLVYDLNVGLKKIELSDLSVEQKIEKLQKFGNKARFKDYAYKIFDIIGDVYLAEKDTTNAIEYFEKSLKTFKTADFEKALVDLKLGEIYYNQEEYVKAQPLYAEVLTIIKKDYKNYREIALRSEVLDELAIYTKTIHEQDSLLHVANLPEPERIAYIEDYIERLKEEERKKKEEEERLRRQMEDEVSRVENAWQNPDLVSSIVDKYKQDQEPKYNFYFYNPNVVSQGKIGFQSVWGKRILEDNWRNMDKSSTFEMEGEESVDEGEALTENTDKPAISNDKYSVDYYLQQLPLTDEAKEKSNAMIDDAMLNLALVYRYLLDNSHLAINTLLDELQRYPDTPHREEIYYQLFMVYLQMDDAERYTYYRNLILSDFPKSKYATPLAETDYAWNFKYMNKMQEEMYQKTYDAYLTGNVNVVRENFQQINTKYPFASLMPKFAFLDALSYAQTRDIINLEKKLNQVVKNYPEEDFIPLAQAILKNIKNGMVILSDGAIIQSIDWENAYRSELDEVLGTDSVDIFSSSPDEPYVLLLNFAENSLDRNDLLYDVADFNFSNFMVKTFDISFLSDSLTSSLIVSKFDNRDDLNSYLQTLKQDTIKNYLSKWNGKVIPVAMTRNVYQSVLPLTDVDNYIFYYNKNLANQFPLIEEFSSLELKDKNKQVLAVDKVDKVVLPNDSLNEAGTKNVYEEPVVIVKDTDKNGQKIEKETPDNEVDLNKVVGKDVMDVLQKVDDIDKKIDDILEDISQNPLEGIKNIFKKNEIEDNLSKEEKAELKKWRKEQAKIEKMKQDSIMAVEQMKQDSIDRAEQMRTDSIKAVEQQKIDAEKAKRQAQIDSIKEAEQKRKEQQQEREERRKQQAKERKQKQKEMEERRKQQMKLQEERRKQQIKEREERRKEQERQRAEQQKNRK